MIQKLVKLTRKVLIILQNLILAQADLITKTDFNNKYLSLNRKIILNKTRSVLNEKELKKLNTFDSSYFRRKNHFDVDGTQNWFVFQPMGKYLEIAYTNTNNSVLSWQSKGLSTSKLKLSKQINICLIHI